LVWLAIWGEPKLSVRLRTNSRVGCARAVVRIVKIMKIRSLTAYSIILALFLFNACDSDEDSGRCKIIYMASERGIYKFDISYKYSPTLVMTLLNTTNGVPDEPVAFEWILDKQGRIIKQQYQKDHGIFIEYIYEDNLVIENQYTDSTLLVDRTDLELNAHGQVIKQQEYIYGSPTIKDYYDIYEYPDNITMNYSKSYHFSQGGLNSEVHDYIYDDKKNPYLCRKSYLPFKLTDNNIVKETITAADGTQKIRDIYYQYNSEGYPTQMIYDNFGPYKETYTYTCN
jgi:hypothetical protein